MDSINEVKMCTKCGEEKELSEFNKDKSRKDGLYCQCKKCSSISLKRYRKSNLEKCAKRQRLYWIGKRELKKEVNLKYAKLNPDKKRKSENESRRKYHIKYRERDRVKELNGRNSLADYYVKGTLIKNGFPKDQITHELIEIKRLILKTKRLCKTSQN